MTKHCKLSPRLQKDSLKIHFLFAGNVPLACADVWQECDHSSLCQAANPGPSYSILVSTCLQRTLKLDADPARIRFYIIMDHELNREYLSL